jgi:hypothetical protein
MTGLRPTIALMTVVAALMPAQMCRADDTTLMRFFIFYNAEDKAFERAVETDIRERARLGFSIVNVVKKVKTRQDFLDAWESIRQEAVKNNMVISTGWILTQASKQSDEQDGLDFAAGPDGGGITRSDIQNLPRLPWIEGGGMLGLDGCNTGIARDRGWCPAQEFARLQKVKTYGAAGFAYFSSHPTMYMPVTNDSKDVYLHTYRRGKNAATGDGKQIPSIRFEP